MALEELVYPLRLVDPEDPEDFTGFVGPADSMKWMDDERDERMEGWQICRY